MRKTAKSTSTDKTHATKNNELTEGKVVIRNAVVHCALLIKWRIQHRRLYLEFLTIETTALQNSAFKLLFFFFLFKVTQESCWEVCLPQT